MEKGGRINVFRNEVNKNRTFCISVTYFAMCSDNLPKMEQEF